MTTSTHTSSPTPIYEELVEEHGDILAEAREAAERSQQTASQALDWSDLRHAALISADVAPGSC